MSEHIWETFDAMYKTAHAQGRRIAELEERIVALERRLATSEVQTSRLRLVTGEADVDEVYERAAADRG